MEGEGGDDEHSRLVVLERRVKELDKVVQEFIKWTKGQIGSLNDIQSKPGRKVNSRNSRARTGKGKDDDHSRLPQGLSDDKASSRGPSSSRIRFTARKSTSGVPRANLPKKSLSRRTTSPNKKKSETKTDNNDSNNSEPFFFEPGSPMMSIKDEVESVHFIDDNSKNDFWFPSPSSDKESESNSSGNEDGCSFHFEISPEETDKLRGKCKAENEDESERKSSGSKRRKPGPKSKTQKPVKMRRWQKKVRVWNWPPPDFIKGLVVRLPPISEVVLAKFGLELPKKTEGTFRRIGQHNCDKCPAQFKKKKDLEAHGKVHRVLKRYTCEFCGRVDRWKNRHLSHVRTHTGEKPNLCELCGVSFNSVGVLVSHRQRVHFRETASKNLKCDYCDKTFFSKSDKSKHEIKIHKVSDKLQDECKICKITFQDSFKAKRHKAEVHDAERKFSCELCGQPFKRRDHLDKHLKRHAAGLKRKRPPQKSSTRVYPALEQLENNKDDEDAVLNERRMQIGEDNSNSNSDSQMDHPEQLTLPNSSSAFKTLNSNTMSILGLPSDTIDDVNAIADEDIDFSTSIP